MVDQHVIEVIELVDKTDPTKTVGWACGQCRYVCESRAAAEACTSCAPCACGMPRKKHRTRCKSCGDIARQKANQVYLRKELARIRTVIPWQEYAGSHVFVDDTFVDLDDIYDDHRFGDSDNPLGWAHGVRYDKEFPRFDVADILRSHYESHGLGEDLTSSLDVTVDAALLQAQLDTWTQAQAYEAWWQDDSVAVIFALSEEAMWVAIRRAQAAR